MFLPWDITPSNAKDMTIGDMHSVVSRLFRRIDIFLEDIRYQAERYYRLKPSRNQIINEKEVFGGILERFAEAHHRLLDTLREAINLQLLLRDTLFSASDELSANLRSISHKVSNIIWNGEIYVANFDDIRKDYASL
jgi:hypothetical protein